MKSILFQNKDTNINQNNKRRNYVTRNFEKDTQDLHFHLRSRTVLEPRFPASEAHRTRTPVGSAYDAVSDTDIWVGHSLLSGRAEKSEKWVLILPLQKIGLSEKLKAAKKRRRSWKENII